MILNREFIDVGDDKHTLVMRTTFDTSVAIDRARMVREYDGNILGTPNDGCEIMGFVPEEMWGYDIHLIAARSALRRNERGLYTRNMRMFFKFHPEFATPHKRAIF